MSEEKAKKPSQKPEAGAAAAPAPAAYGKKKVKQEWSLSRCKKFARRYTNAQEWEAGSPSSFKAATANGWMSECKTLFKKSEAPAKKLRKSA